MNAPSPTPVSPRVYIVVAIVAALIGGAATIAAALLSWLPIPTVPGQFGEWQTMRPETVYPAETSGFVAVHTHWGDTEGAGLPNNLLIHTGPGQSDDDMSVCSRAGRYQGALCPVQQGHYWQVEVRKGEVYDASTVTVKWLPVRSPP